MRFTRSQMRLASVLVNCKEQNQLEYSTVKFIHLDLAQAFSRIFGSYNTSDPNSTSLSTSIHLPGYTLFMSYMVAGAIKHDIYFWLLSLFS